MGAIKYFKCGISWEVITMCSILSGQPLEAFTYETRSVRLGGHATSIKLEGAFWDILDEIAAELQMPLGKFLTEMHDEVLLLSGDAHNFTSLLRCACLTYVTEVRGKPDSQSILGGALKKSAATGLQAAE
jgi:predicted DNA-binding ribbon-helix-helix protein